MCTWSNPKNSEHNPIIVVRSISIFFFLFWGDCAALNLPTDKIAIAYGCSSECIHWSVFIRKPCYSAGTDLAFEVPSFIYIYIYLRFNDPRYARVYDCALKINVLRFALSYQLFLYLKQIYFRYFIVLELYVYVVVRTLQLNLNSMSACLLYLSNRKRHIVLLCNRVVLFRLNLLKTSSAE